MKRNKNLFLIGLIAFIFSSCSVSAPLTVTDNEVGDKVGKSSYTVILGIFKPFDANAGIEKAAKNGQITEVATVDRKVKGGIFSTTYTTIVTGE